MKIVDEIFMIFYERCFFFLLIEKSFPSLFWVLSYQQQKRSDDKVHQIKFIKFIKNKSKKLLVNIQQCERKKKVQKKLKR